MVGLSQTRCGLRQRYDFSGAESTTDPSGQFFPSGLEYWMIAFIRSKIGLLIREVPDGLSAGLFPTQSDPRQVQNQRNPPIIVLDKLYFMIYL